MRRVGHAEHLKSVKEYIPSLGGTHEGIRSRLGDIIKMDLGTNFELTRDRGRRIITKLPIPQEHNTF
jgi:hypothetical protein